jgi:hypothetical protein
MNKQILLTTDKEIELKDACYAFSKYRWDDLSELEANPSYWLKQNIIIEAFTNNFYNEINIEQIQSNILRGFSAAIKQVAPAIQNVEKLIQDEIHTLDWDSNFLEEALDILIEEFNYEEIRDIRRLCTTFFTEEDLAATYIKDYPNIVAMTQNFSYSFAMKQKLDIDVILTHNEQIDVPTKNKLKKANQIKYIFIPN